MLLVLLAHIDLARVGALIFAPRSTVGRRPQNPGLAPA
jgi:hypothetical protein